MDNDIMPAAPQHKGQGAFDAFLNLLSLITAGWTSIAIGMVLFQLINKFFGSKAIDYVSGFAQEPLKFGIASAIIVTPIFLAVSGWLHRSYKTGQLNHQSGIHRWLTYLMLLISALTIIGRLIYQLFRFLDGDYASSVILKTLVMFVIAGSIFGYYLYDLMRKDFSRRSAVSLAMMIFVIVVALASVIGGFFIIDSPTQARALKFDTQRVNDLTNLNSGIVGVYSDTKSLPTELSAGQFSYNRFDPETNQPYEYRVISADQYELCATFSLATPKDQAGSMMTAPIAAENFYYHGAGRQCFVKSATQNFKAL